MQAQKHDDGKIRLSLVPPVIIWAMAMVREYGVHKYGNVNGWMSIRAERYWDAFLRHIFACWYDLTAVDEESGLPHLWHAACNLAFIIALIWTEDKIKSFKRSIKNEQT